MQKYGIPVKWREKLGFLKHYAVYTPKNIAKWKRLREAPVIHDGKARVFYGFDHMASPKEFENGGMVKFQAMIGDYPNTPESFNVLYMLSSRMPADWRQLLHIAQERGALILWNQNGVAYPAWHGFGWSITNHPMTVMLREADHVFYQSTFCRETADRFATARSSSAEIIYNPVNTQHFQPGPVNSEKPFLLVGGTQQHLFKVAIPMRTLALLREDYPDLRLRILGKLTWKADKATREEAMALARELGIAERVDFMGPYSQQEAPGLMQGAQALIHPKYNDPCPGLVLEAMACGLPIVYSRSGGVPELVAESAGIGIPCDSSFVRDILPDPAAIADALKRVMSNREPYSQAARKRAMEAFDSRQWLKHHQRVINKYLAENGM